MYSYRHGLFVSIAMSLYFYCDEPISTVIEIFTQYHVELPSVGLINEQIRCILQKPT